MKRIFAILMVCLFMVAVMALTASTAFAGPNCTGNPDDRKAASCKVDAKGGDSKDTGGANFVDHGKKL